MRGYTGRNFSPQSNQELSSFAVGKLRVRSSRLSGLVLSETKNTQRFRCEGITAAGFDPSVAHQKLETSLIDVKILNHGIDQHRIIECLKRNVGIDADEFREAYCTYSEIVRNNTKKLVLHEDCTTYSQYWTISEITLILSWPDFIFVHASIKARALSYSVKFRVWSTLVTNPSISNSKNFHAKSHMLIIITAWSQHEVSTVKMTQTKNSCA